VGIEFYAWDFTYNKENGFKPAIIMDREGKQIKNLQAGKYNIAVKAVDINGLESMDVFQLKINGMAKRVKGKGEN
jgi:hypothetical protein